MNLMLIYETLDYKWYKLFDSLVLCTNLVCRYFCTIMSELSLLKSRPLTPCNFCIEGFLEIKTVCYI